MYLDAGVDAREQGGFVGLGQFNLGLSGNFNPMRMAQTSERVVEDEEGVATRDSKAVEI